MITSRRFCAKFLAVLIAVATAWPSGVLIEPAYAAAPGQVQNVHASDTDAGAVTVIWDALQDVNVQGYRVYRNTVRGGAVYANISGNLTPATTQYVDDLAFGDSGVVTAPDTLQASNNDNAQITVTWSGETVSAPAVPYNYYVVAYDAAFLEGPQSAIDTGNVRPAITQFEVRSSTDATVDLTDTALNPNPLNDHDVVEAALGFNTTRYYKVRAYAASLDDDGNPAAGANGWTILSVPTSIGVTMAEAPQNPAVTPAYDAANGFYVDVTGYEPLGGATSYATLEIDQTGPGAGGSDMASSANTTFRDTGLNGNTLYTYRVRALNALNRPSAWSASVSGTTPPDASGINMSHSANTANSINWDWADVPGALTYNANDSVSGASTSGLAASAWNEGSLSANTLYTAYATPVDASGPGQPSSSHSAYSSIETPTGINFNAVTENSIGMTVNGPSVPNPFTNLTLGSSGVYIDETTGMNGGADSPWQQGLTYTNVGLQPNTQYTYHAQARNGDGEATGFSASQNQVTLAAVPGALTAAPTSSSSINLQINANGNPNGTQYEIVYDENPVGAFAGVVENWTAHNNGDVVAHNGLTPNKIYYYKTRARNQSAVATTYSAVSSAVTLAVVPNVTANPPANVWQKTPGFTFTNTVGWVNLDHMHYRWNNNLADMALGTDPIWNTSNDPLALTAPSDGAWYLHILSHNFNHGNSGNASYGPFQYDATPPSSNALPLPAITNQAQFNIAFVYDASVSGLNHVKLGTSFIPPGGMGGGGGIGGSYTVSPIVFDSNQAGGDGTYGFYTVAVDNAGNQEASPANPDAQIIVDRTPPTAVAALSALTTPTRTSPVLNWAASTDSGTGMAYYRVYRSQASGQRGIQINVDGATIGVTYTDNSLVADGRYYYTVQPVDSAGNEQMTGNNQVTVVYDTTSPAVVSFEINAGQNYTTSLNVTLNSNVTDANPPVEMHFGIDHNGDNNPDSGWSAYEAYNPSKAFTITNNPNGAERVIAQYRDVAQNESAVVGDSIIYDNNAPNNVAAVNEVSASGIIDNIWQNDSRDASFTWAVPADNPAAPDSNSGIQNYDVYWGTDSGVPAAPTITVFGPNYDPPAAPTANGKATYYLRLKTRDNLDFASSWSPVLFTLKYDERSPDTPVPQTSSLNQNGWSNNNDFDFYWSKPADNVGATDYDYHVDAVADTNTANEFVNNIIGTEDTHIFYVRANDEADNHSNYGQANFSFDATNPNPPVQNSAVEAGGATHDVWQNQVSNPNFTSWGAATDPGATASGIWNYDVYFGTSAAGTTIDAGVTVTAYDPNVTLNSGDTYYLRSRARDMADNTSPWQTLFTLRYENQAPTGTVIINGDAASTQVAAVTLSLTANDTPVPGSGVTSMRFQNEGGAWSAWEPYVNTKAWTLDIVSEGLKRVYVQLRDGAGNVSAGNISDTISYDATNPTFTVNTADGTWVNVTSPTVNVDFNDNVQLLSVYYKVGAGGAWQQIATNIGANNYVADFQVMGLAEGVNNLFFRAVDSAGHDFAPADAPHVLVLNVDTGIPGTVGLTSSSHISGVFSMNANVVFNWTEPTSSSPVIGYRYIVDGAAGTVITGAAGETAMPAGTLTVTVPVVNPISYFHIAAVDTAGNFGVTDHFNVLFDNIPPNSSSVTINGGNPATAIPIVTLTISATDMESGIGALSRMQFSNGGGIFSAPEAYFPTKMWDVTDNGYGGDPAQGVKTVTMRVSDAAGNWITVPVTDTIMYDPNPPTAGTVTINAGANSTNNPVVSLALGSSDVGGSGLAAMRISNDGATWLTIPYAATYPNWDITVGAYGGNGSQETKTVYVEYQDAAGNWSAPSATDTIIYDTSAPTGGSFQIGNGMGTNQQFNNLNNITAGDAQTPVTLIKISNDNVAFTADLPFAPFYLNWDILDPAYGGAPGDGVKNVYMQFGDEAGNWSASAHSSIILDTVEPASGSFVINGGAASTTSLVVTLDNINAADNAGGSGIAQMQFSNNSAGPWSALEPYVPGATKAGWDLSAFGGNINGGVKTVYARFQDHAGNISVTLVVSDSIQYIQSNPVHHFAFTPAIPAQISGMQVNGPYTVQMQDSPLNNPAVEMAGRTIYLYTNSASGMFYSDAAGLNAITSFVIPAGQSAGQFYYFDVPAVVPAAVVLTASDATPLDNPDAGIVNAVANVSVRDLTPPTFAGISSGAATSPTQINIGWAAATDDYTVNPANIVYNIYRAAVSGGQNFVGAPTASVTGQLTYTDNGLTPSTQYFYVVRAQDQAGNGDANVVERMVQTPIVGGDAVLPVFAGLTSAAAVSSTRIDLNWAAATDNVTQPANIAYNIYRATTSGGQNFGAFTTQVTGVTTYADTDGLIGLTPNTQYFYVVRARDEALREDVNVVEGNATTFAVADAQNPVFAGLATVSAPNANTAHLTWLPATDNQTPAGSILYRIYRSNASMANNPLPPSIASVTGVTSFDDPSLSPNTTYYYMVRAVDASGNGEANQAELIVTTPPANNGNNNVVVPPGGGGGGGYPGNRSPYPTKVLVLPLKESDELLTTDGPVSFATTKGLVTSPLKLIDKFNNIVVNIEKGTQITNANGSPFTGTLKPPYKITFEEVTIPIPEGIQTLGRYAYKFGTLGEKFDKPVILEAQASLSVVKMLEEGRGVVALSWNVAEQKWLPLLVDKILKEDGNTFALPLDRSTLVIFVTDATKTQEVKKEVKKQTVVETPKVETPKEEKILFPPVEVETVVQPKPAVNEVAVPFVVTEMLSDVSLIPYFADVDENNPAFYAIQKLVEGDVLDFSQENFSPDSVLSRAAMVKLALKAFGVSPEPNEAMTFADVPAGEWYAPYAERAKLLSIIPNGLEFAANKDVTRGEALMTLLRASLLRIPDGVVTTATDIPDNETGKYVGFAEEKGIVMFNENGRFYPEKAITRGEFAMLAERVISLVENAEEEDLLPMYSTVSPETAVRSTPAIPAAAPAPVIASIDAAPFFKNFKKGDSDPDVTRIKKILGSLGFYAGSYDEMYTDALADAVFAFQSSKGIVPNRDFYGAGMVGNGTRRELNEQLESFSM